MNRVFSEPGPGVRFGPVQVGEERPYIGGQQVGSFQRGEVATAVELRPIVTV